MIKYILFALVFYNCIAAPEEEKDIYGREIKIIEGVLNPLMLEGPGSYPYWRISADFDFSSSAFLRVYVNGSLVISDADHVENEIFIYKEHIDNLYGVYRIEVIE